MIREKTKVPKTPRLTSVVEILGLHELFFPHVFLAFFKKNNKQKTKKTNKQRNSSIKYAVVNSNELKSKWNQESSGYLKSFSTWQTYEIINHNKQSCLSVLHDIAWQIFAPGKKVSYINIPKISIHLFIHFYFFRFISSQFADFTSQKIQMKIIFSKPCNILNNAA